MNTSEGIFSGGSIRYTLRRRQRGTLWTALAAFRLAFIPATRYTDRRPAFRAVEEPFTLDDLGGPNEAEREILRGVFRDRVLAELES